MMCVPGNRARKLRDSLNLACYYWSSSNTEHTAPAPLRHVKWPSYQASPASLPAIELVSI